MDVVAGILARGDRYLAARRSASMSWPGFWEFPGGKVEPGESLEEALTRELREELDIDVRAFSLWKIKEKKVTGRAIRVHFFSVTDFAGTPTPREGQELAWLSLAEAATYVFLSADAEILAELPATPTW